MTIVLLQLRSEITCISATGSTDGVHIVIVCMHNNHINGHTLKIIISI